MLKSDSSPGTVLMEHTKTLAVATTSELKSKKKILEFSTAAPSKNGKPRTETNQSPSDVGKTYCLV
jgi:hypothetical protein